MRSLPIKAGLVVAVLAICGPAIAQQVPPPGPSPAVVKMRWQWLNPEINSFTFRDTDNRLEK